MTFDIFLDELQTILTDVQGKFQMILALTSLQGIEKIEIFEPSHFFLEN